LAVGGILKILEVLAATEKDDGSPLDGSMFNVCFKSMNLSSAGGADEFSNRVEESLKGSKSPKLGPFAVPV